MNLDVQLKAEVYQTVKQLIDEKILTLKKELSELLNSGGEETKSSAGDKHEVGKAMLQLEQEKLGKQLFEVEQMRNLFGKIASDAICDKACLGALVSTTHGVFYLAVSIGAVSLQKNKVFVLSMMSPVGKLLLDKKTGDTFLFNGNKAEILAIC